MADRIIENPIINSPYRVPDRHFKFDDEGITNEVVSSRRPSQYFVPVPRPRKRGQQIELDFAEFTADKIREVLDLDDKGKTTREMVNDSLLSATKDKIAAAGEDLRANRLPRLHHWSDTCGNCDLAGLCRTRQ